MLFSLTPQPPLPKRGSACCTMAVADTRCPSRIDNNFNILPTVRYTTTSPCPTKSFRWASPFNCVRPLRLVEGGFGWSLILLLFIFSCSRNDITTNPACRLAFPVDTVRFDTVFTTLGSATKRLVVHNPNKQAIRTNITLAGGHYSPFRINIDGLSAESATDVEIAAKDSMYIFLEVTVDPQSSDLPVVIYDSVLFETNTNRQHVVLEAYGQDVFILRNETIQSQMWSGVKPYLIYGRLTVDTLETLHIRAGVHIYLHKEADIYVKGSMITEGEADNPVIFTSDRLEKLYRDIPGQWGSIIFGTASRDNILRYTEIRNGTNGILFGNPAYEQVPALTLDAAIIMNMSHSGLLAFASDVNATNCVVANCGSYTTGLFCGGTSRFVYCSIANGYSTYIRRKANSALTISNTYPETAENPIVGKIPGNVFFGNSIIYGTLSGELSIDNTDCLFDYCLLRTTEKNDSPVFINVMTNTDPLFVAPSKGNFRLSEDSKARDAGNAAIGASVTKDLDGNDRIIGPAPDLGAYEWIEPPAEP